MIPAIEDWNSGANDLLIARIFYELEEENRDAFVDQMRKFLAKPEEGQRRKRLASGARTAGERNQGERRAREGPQSFTKGGSLP